jgi:hypothetical protein
VPPWLARDDSDNTCIRGENCSPTSAPLTQLNRCLDRVLRSESTALCRTTRATRPLPRRDLCLEGVAKSGQQSHEYARTPSRTISGNLASAGRSDYVCSSLGGFLSNRYQMRGHAEMKEPHSVPIWDHIDTANVIDGIDLSGKRAIITAPMS